jgi:flagellar biogenesis protein FliO
VDLAQGDDPAERDYREPLGWTQVLLLAAKLILVIGLVYAVLAGLRWLRRLGTGQVGQRRSGDQNPTIHVLETATLTPSRSLHLISVGEKTLLIGATDQQLSLLAELADVATPLPDIPVESSSSFEHSVDEAHRFDEVLSSVHQPIGPPWGKGPVGDWQPQGAAWQPQGAAWQAALDSLRAGVRRIRESVGG